VKETLFRQTRKPRNFILILLPSSALHQTPSSRVSLTRSVSRNSLERLRAQTALPRLLEQPRVGCDLPERGLVPWFTQRPVRFSSPPMRDAAVKTNPSHFCAAIDGIERSVKPSYPCIRFNLRNPVTSRLESIVCVASIRKAPCSLSSSSSMRIRGSVRASHKRSRLLSFQRVNPQWDSDATWTLMQQTLKSEHYMQVPALPAFPRSGSGVCCLPVVAGPST
jgi:hypothetical protein